MNILERFMEYANDFERTYSDDDWQRIKPYFTADAVYRVDFGEFGSTMKGPDAIAAGIRKSVNGFDRRFTTREIEVIGSPEIEGDEIRMTWAVTYTLDGYENYILRGRSTVRYRDGLIVELTDHYDAEAAAYLVAWQSRNDLPIDPSYT